MIYEHKLFLDNLIESLKLNEDILGVAAAGSYITDEMDEFSDIDLVIAVNDESYEKVMKERLNIVNSFGELLSAFTGEHVGEPRLIICLYDNPLVHVDFKFVKFSDIAHRVEDFKILWEKDNCITNKMKEEAAIFPVPNIQWIEDRFWVWIHYGATKIGRGELFEAIEFISFLRQTVIGPLILLKKGKQPKGVRKIEIDAPEFLDELINTVATYNKESVYYSLKNIILLYKDLRNDYIFDNFQPNIKAEDVATRYLEDIFINFI
ncbi:MAG: aminoglycoside 6-adenylyltransferase [Pleomorphochaeta sp.]